MHGQGFLFQAFIFLAASVVSVPIAKRLGLGSVLGYLIAGIAIGPFGLGLIGTAEDILHFAEFGVVMMLFLIGLELEPVTLWRLRGTLFGMGGIQVGATAAALAAIAIALGVAVRPAIAIGLILSLSSTAIVLQSLTEKGLLKTDAGERSFAVLLFQDLAVIPMLALLPLLAIAGAGAPSAAVAADGGLFDQLPAWERGLLTLGAIVAVILAGRFLVRPAFRFIARAGVHEVFTAAALLLVVGIALLMTQVGLSPALGTFLGGVVLANSEYRHELESDIAPFKGLLLGLFFLAVGASIDFALVGERVALLGALVPGLIVAKFAVLFAIARLFRMGLSQSLLFALALAQGGEFCFVLLSFSAHTGVLDPTTAGTLVATVALSMALTPLLLLLHERVIAPRLESGGEPVEREPDEFHEENPVIVAGFGAFGSLVGRFLIANGVRATLLDADSDNVELLRRLGLRVFYGDASREDLLRAAGAERARVLMLSTGDPEKTLSIVQTVKREFPSLKIYARAHFRSEAYDLIEAGVDGVYRESLDTALRAGVDILRALGFRAHQAHRAAQSFRRQDERAVAELAAARHDQEIYLTRARESIRDLERNLRAEVQNREPPDDAAWDPESLRAEYGEAEPE